VRPDAVVATRRAQVDLLIAGDGEDAGCRTPQDDVDADPFAVRLGDRVATAQAEVRAVGDAEPANRGPARAGLREAPRGAGQLGDHVAVAAAGGEREGDRVQRPGGIGGPARASVDRRQAGDQRRGEGVAHPGLQAGREGRAAGPGPGGEVAADAADHGIPDLAVVGRIRAAGGPEPPADQRGEGKDGERRGDARAGER
jgi:hypothetical protein